MKKDGFTLIDQRTSRGFTLIEISIVLVIIGLITGGVLVGRDLIRAAEIRGTVSQLEKIRTSVNSFKLKYGYLPGDMPPAAAGSFGFFQANSGSDYDNGFLNTSPINEANIFWRHLTDASMIEGQFGTSASNPLTATGAVTNGTATDFEKLFYPEVKAAAKIYWNVVGPTYRYSPSMGPKFWNDFQTYQYSAFSLDPMLMITPVLAHSLDSKIDDGKPNTGNMIEIVGAISGPFGGWSTTPENWYCTYGGANLLSPDTRYNINPSTGGNTRACSIRIKAGF